MDKRKPVTVGDVVCIVCPYVLKGTFLVSGIHDEYIIIKDHEGNAKLISRHWIVNREFIEEDGA